MSLASLKRSLAIGTQLKLTRHDWFPKGSMTVRGNLGTTQLKGRIAIGSIRPIVEVKATEIGLKTGDDVSYLTWPKAAHVRETSNGFEIDLNHDGKFTDIMAYEIIPANVVVGEPAPLPAHIPDFTVQNEGTIYILYAQTDAAKAWVNEHLPADRQTWGGNGTVVEHRYICDIIDGIKADGLTVR